MAVYNLPREEKWPAGLARVIQSYMQGQQAKKQMALSEGEARQKQQKTEADIAMKNAYITLLKGLGGGGRPEGPPQGPPQGGGDVMPGLEDGAGARVSGWGPSGPRVEFQKPRTPEELIGIIAKIASHKDEFPEGSPQRKLADQAMMNLQKQLAKAQGMEMTGEAPETRYRGSSILGENWFTDLLKKDKPDTRQLVPKGTPFGPQPRKPEVPPGMQDLLQRGTPVKPQAITPGMPPGAPKGPTMFQLQKEAGIYDRNRPSPSRKGAGTPRKYGPVRRIKGEKEPVYGMLEPPKDNEGSIPPPAVLKAWDTIPISVKAEIDRGLRGGLTWKEIAASENLKKYLK